MVTNVNNSKSSVQKGIRSQVLEQFPHIGEYIDQVLPKKEALKIVKWLVMICVFPHVFITSSCVFLHLCVYAVRVLVFVNMRVVVILY